MPVSVRRSPFGDERSGVGRETTEDTTRLRTPQARVLAALVPSDLTHPPSEWPLLNRAMLSVRAGYTAISGTTTRALNGIHEGSSSGDPHPGLLAMKLVEEVVLDVEGVSEINYRATPAGVRAYQSHLAAQGGSLPQVRDAATCTNDRYRGGN